MQLDEYLKSKVRFHLGFNAGAQIILLPEDGIHGYGHISRETLRPFLEFVPPVADGSVPCYEDGVDDAAGAGLDGDLALAGEQETGKR